MSGNNINYRCPNCKQDTTAQGKAHTLAMTCSHCGVYFRTGKWNDVYEKFTIKHVPKIPIGSKGRFEGDLYQVLGFVVKKDKQYLYYLQ